MDKPNIYQRSKVYKIVCNITGLCYIGSTTQKYLSQRLAMHNCCYKQWNLGKHHFVTSYKIIEKGDYEMILIEDFPCERKEQLHARERFYIENTVCFNTNLPSITKIKSQAEYRETNKEQIAKRMKKYY